MFAAAKHNLVFRSAILTGIAATVGAANAIAISDSMSCGKMCVTKGDYKKAAQDFEAVVKKSPKSCEGHLLLGQVYCKLKQYQKAKQQLRLAIRTGHGSVNAQKANVQLLKLPEQFQSPRTGPETKMIASLLGLPKTGEGASRPTVIDFYATWCNPCKQLNTILDKAKTEYGDKVTFMRIDVDDPANEKLLDKYEISPIPTVVFLNAQGEVVSFAVGFSGDITINNGIKKILTEG